MTQPIGADTDRMARLIAVCHHAWALDVLVDLGRRDGSGVASLAHRVWTSRTLLRSTLAALAGCDLVTRRPPRLGAPAGDYALTSEGRRVARVAERLVFVLHRRRIYHVARRKWCLPILLAIQECAKRFNQLKTCLPGITSRALSAALKELCGAGLVERWVVDEYPPRTCYRLTTSAEMVVPLLERI